MGVKSVEFVFYVMSSLSLLTPLPLFLFSSFYRAFDMVTESRIQKRERHTHTFYLFYVSSVLGSLVAVACKFSRKSGPLL